MKANVTLLALLATLAMMATSCGLYSDLDYTEVTTYGTPYYYEGTTYYYYNNTYYVPYYANGGYVMRHAPSVPRDHFVPANNRPRPTGTYYGGSSYGNGNGMYGGGTHVSNPSNNGNHNGYNNNNGNHNGNYNGNNGNNGNHNGNYNHNNNNNNRPSNGNTTTGGRRPGNNGTTTTKPSGNNGNNGTTAKPSGNNGNNRPTRTIGGGQTTQQRTQQSTQQVATPRQATTTKESVNVSGGRR